MSDRNRFSAMARSISPLARTMALVVALGEMSTMAVGGAVSETLLRTGFEDGADGWGPVPNMAVDDDVAHIGDRSLRLTVTDPRVDPVYVIRHIPVRGGAYYAASCHVRTENVVPAPGAKPSAGAGLIVEWADRSGRWLHSGQYELGIRGTTGWTRKVCNALRAPDDAGFAIVFLALRDAGTAWFDDFEFSAVNGSIRKRAPADGASVSNNCPALEWDRRPGIRVYTVELSQDPAFADETVRRIDVPGFPHVQLETPLPPGEWHWRVVANGIPDDAPWTFRQTAPTAVDCLAPQLAVPGARVTSSREPFVVSLRDGGSAPPRVAFLGAKGVCSPARRDGLRKCVFAPPPRGWPQGLSQGALVATDAAGNASTNDFWLLNAPKPSNAVEIDGAGFFRQAGRRIFPIGIYEVLTNDMAEVRADGFDMVHWYLWERNQDDAACAAYLDACWAADGLRAFIGFDRGHGTGRGLIQGNAAHVAHRVGTLASHPALFCWYLYDEPERMSHFIAPEPLAALADLIRALDPYHPVVMSTWDETMKEHRRSWDTHWTQAYGNPAQVVDQIEEHRRFLDHASPMTLLIGCYDDFQSRRKAAGLEPDPAAFSRDEDFLRACAFLGIARGTNGLVWWWFGRDSQEFYSASQCPPAWANIVKIVGELRAFRPIVEAEGEETYGLAESGADKVAWWWKRLAQGGECLLAVNTADHPVTATVALPDGSERRLALGRYEVLIEKGADANRTRPVCAGGVR